MPRVIRLLVLLAVLLPVAPSAHAATQDNQQLRRLAERFLATRIAGLPGEIDYRVDTPRAVLPACPAPVAFLPEGTRLIGKTLLGVRCDAPSRWTVYLAARISQITDYVSAARPLPAGYTLADADLALQRGDLGQLPPDVLTDRAAAVGMELASGLAANAPLRSRLLRAPLVARAGQPLALVLDGPGFALRHTGVALANARVGDTVRVRSAGGVVVSGVARADGSVLVSP